MGAFLKGSSRAHLKRRLWILGPKFCVTTIFPQQIILSEQLIPSEYQTGLNPWFQFLCFTVISFAAKECNRRGKSGSSVPVTGPRSADNVSTRQPLSCETERTLPPREAVMDRTRKVYNCLKFCWKVHTPPGFHIL